MNKIYCGKVTIFGSPVFFVPMDQETVGALMKLAAAHYDSTYKSAGQIGGFLYRINNQVNLIASKSETIPVRILHKQVDTLINICEVADYASNVLSMNEAIRIAAFILSMRRLMIKATTISSAWEAEVEV
jgi:hypothetical protein